MLLEQEHSKKQISELIAEAKKSTLTQFSLGLSTLTHSQDFSITESQDTPNSGGNLKKIQQELRVSKKAEQLAKEKLAQSKKSLERSEKDFIKYREDAESRIESLKNEVGILQKHYDQLQNSINESELERSSHNSNSGNEKSAELIKIIEEYSKQTETKSKEIELINAKLDKKQNKVDDLKKFKTDSEIKIHKLKSTLDNVKTFLRLLNSNYMKSMKIQSTSLKEQFSTCQNEFIKELQTMKQNVSAQINKIVNRKEKEHQDAVNQERLKSQQLENKLSIIQGEHETKLVQQKEESDLNTQNQKETLSKKINKLKDRISQISNLKQSEGDEKNMLKDQYLNKIQQIERDNEMLKLKMMSEQDKFQIQLSELQKDIMNKTSLMTDLKDKDQKQQKKFEDQEQRQRVELIKMTERFDSDKLTWLQRETDLSGSREAERLKELKDVYETKTREKDEELKRFRETISRYETDFMKLKDEGYKKGDEIVNEKRELEKENLLLKSSFAELEKKLSTQGDKISKMKAKQQDNHIKINQLNTQITTHETQNKQIQTQVIELKDQEMKLNKEMKVQEQRIIIKVNENQTLIEKIDYLENTIDHIKFDLNDEIKDKERVIEDLHQQLLRMKQQDANLQENLMTQKQQIQDLQDQLQISQEMNINLSQQIDQLSQSVNQLQNLQIAQNTNSLQDETTKPLKKKKIVKRKKLLEIDTQTETKVEQDIQIMDKVLSIEIVKEQSASPPMLQSPTIRGQHIGKIQNCFTFQEEDSFSAQPVEESQERRLIQRNDQPDMAMRGPPPFNATNRMLGPRPQGQQMGRGRGAPPGFQPRPNLNQGIMNQPFGVQPRPETTPISLVEEQKIESTQIQQTEENKMQLEQPVIKQTIKVEMKQVDNFQSVEQKVQSPMPIKEFDANTKQDQFEDSLQTSRASVQQQIKQEPIPKQEEEKKFAPIPVQQQAQPSILDLRNNRFFGMINGFIGFLTRRKQGFTGRPAASMQWDEKKKRYIIDGEDESDDDVPLLPPPQFKKEVTQSQQIASSTEQREEVKNEQKPKEQEFTNSSDLTKPQLPSYLANRGRGRGRGAAAVTQNRFPQTFGQNQIVETKLDKVPEEEKQNIINDNQQIAGEQQQNIQEEIHEQIIQEDLREEVSELYTTTLDITMNQTQFIRKPKQEARFDEVRESQWLDKFSSQQEKINNLKYKMSMLQQELKMQRDENEQTVENFTILCQDLKFKGMDEVEDLQSDIQILRDQLKALTYEKANFEVKNTQFQDALQYYEQENEELRQQSNNQRIQLIQAQVDKEVINQQIKDEQHNTEDDIEQYKEILDLQSENSSLKWQKSILEAEKFSKNLEIKDLANSLDSNKVKLLSLENENQKLIEDHKKTQTEFQVQSQEQLNKLEKEKENLREMITKVQLEKERIQEQNKERFAEYESKFKLSENDKQKYETDIARVAREKEVVIEQLKNKSLTQQQAIQQKDSEIGFQQEQINQLQAKVNQLIQKRQNESEQAELMMKNQLKQIQEILVQKTSQLQQYESKQEEINQELNNMNTFRHKLTENIVYLQNEIRKRDELLETSEFGDFDIIGDESDSVIAAEDESIRGYDMQSNKGDDAGAAGQSQRHSQYVNIKRKKRTFGQQLQNQLDDTRSQLKSQIEEKMRVQRQYQLLERNFTRLSESLNDVNSILDQQQQNCGINSASYEQSSQLFQEEESKSTQDEKNASMVKDDSLIMRGVQLDELQHQIISKIFSISRYYESEISEQKHKYKLIIMQLEESENLKFDIEILTEEKSMNEAELQQQRLQIRDLDIKNQDIQSKYLQSQRTEEDLKQQIEIITQKAEQQILIEKQAFENQINGLREENQMKINEIHDTFKNQILPEIKQKHSAKYKGLQDNVNQMKEEYNTQLEEQKRIIQSLDHQNKSILNQSQIQIESENEEKDRLKEQLTLMEIQKQELENKMNIMKANHEKIITDFNEETKSLRKEIEIQNKQYNEYKENLETYFKQAAMKLKQKIDEKKKFIKDLQHKFKEQIQIIINEHQNEITNLTKQKEENVKNMKEEFESEKNEFIMRIETIEKDKIELQANLESQAQNQMLEIVGKLKTEAEEERLWQQNLSNDLKSQLTDLNSQIEVLQAKLVEKEQEIPVVEEKQPDLTQELQEKINHVQELQEKVNECEAKINELQVQLEEAETSKQSEIENLQNITRHVKQQFREENEKLQTELESLSESRSQEISNYKEALDKTVDVNDENLKNLQTQIQELQLMINELESKNEELDNKLKSKQEEIEKYDNDYKSQLKDVQDKLEQQIQVAQELSSSNQKAVSKDQYDLQIQILDSEWEAKLKLKDDEFTKEKQDMLDYFNSRELELKSMAEQIAVKLKGDLKKQKEKVKNALVLLEQTQNEKEELQQTLDQLIEQRDQGISINQQQDNQKIQNLQDQAKSLQELIDVQKIEIANLQNTNEETNQANKQLIEQQQKMISDILEILSQIELPMDTLDQDQDSIWQKLTDKLRELLQNYEEDKRSLKDLMHEKQELQNLRDTYYYEKESLTQEKSVLQEKLEKSDAHKLEKKVKMLEEERSEMRSDFYIKINSFVEEVSHLKQQLSRYVEPIYEEQKSHDSQQNRTILGDVSQTSQTEIHPTFMDQSKTSMIQPVGQKPNNQYLDTSAIQQQQQKSGLFTSIASFFLTDSEIDNQ